MHCERMAICSGSRKLQVISGVRNVLNCLLLLCSGRVNWGMAGPSA